MMKKRNVNTPKKSKGQILVMYAIMMLVLVALIGLAIDVGYMYVSYARLRRAVDAAALDASNQIKEGYQGQDLESAAEQFLRLNDINDPTAEVRFCNPAPAFAAWHDPGMCTTPPRKLVSVTASSEVPTFFMAALGFNSLTISASAESEAASVDVILVIDISASQVNGSGDSGSAREDPYWCNRVNLGSAMEGGCTPFEDVKNAAMSFVDEAVFLEYDRVGIVTFSRFANRYLELSHSETAIKDAIRNLQVDNLELCPYQDIQPVSLASMGSQCRHYKVNPTVAPSTANEATWSENFLGMSCPQRILWEDAVAAGDTTAANIYRDLIPHCNNTNSGAGLLTATDMFLDPAYFRDESTWVVIFLTDGGANIGYKESKSFTTDPLTKYCPTANIDTLCRDGNPNVRHDAISQPFLYDPDDYARDAMDNLFGNQVYVFTIGQGPLVASSAEASAIIEYAEGHDSGNGASYFGSGEAELRQIFLAIANRISTRLTR